MMKPVSAPVSAKEMTASSNSAASMNQKPKVREVTIPMDPARPSMPSIILKALVMATMTMVVMIRVVLASTS